jgi:hypothetical protein
MPAETKSGDLTASIILAKLSIVDELFDPFT